MKWDIGEACKTIRVNYEGMSLEAFSKNNGVSTTQLWRIEKNVAPPPEHFIRLLCYQHKVNREWLETGRGEPTTDKSFNKQFKIERLRPKTRKTLISSAAILAPFIPAASVGIIIGIGVDGVLEKMKKAYNVKSNRKLAEECFNVHKSAISRWRKSNNIPLKHIEQTIKDTNFPNNYFLFRDSTLKDAINALTDFAYSQIEKSKTSDISKEQIREDLISEFDLAKLQL